MKVRFLLHDVFVKGGGVLTVTLGLAEALAATEDVEIVSLFGRKGEPVHQLGADLPRTVLINVKERPQGHEAEALGVHEPSQVIPAAESRYSTYSRYSDGVLRDYLGGLRDGALVTMQPGMSIAAARLGTPDYVRIAQDHRPFIARPKPIRNAYARSADGLDAFLTITSADEALYRDFLGDATRVELMPNGTPQFSGPPSTLDSKLVLAAGRLGHSKGFDLLIDAWRTVADKHPEWKLHIYGKGSERPALRAQINELGLQEQVHLKGFSTSLQERMAEASLFVLSSRVEGYGMVLVEAMACGVPVVSTDAPFGPAEIVSDGVDGLLVANEDPDALAAGILRMIELPRDERLAMGAAALAKAGERSHAAVAERWRTLIAECDEQRRSQRKLTSRVRARLIAGDSRRRDRKGMQAQ